LNGERREVCNTEAMQLHLDDIAPKVAPSAHAILIFDQAGWHGAKALKTPPNLSLMPLPPRSPELNPLENIWQFMRQNWLSNRVFKSYDDIVDHCCFAWNTLIEQQLAPQRLVDRQERNRNDLQGCVALDQIPDPPGEPARCRGTDLQAEAAQ
jgi:DDE superfamily endonuclease